ncbi:molybdopterin-binding domain-containing protein [Rhizobium leguminosarum]
MIIVVGAYVAIDHGDFIPAGSREAVSRILRVDMPIDPGNLMVSRRDRYLLCRRGGRVYARSPKGNGFDRLPERILAGERTILVAWAWVAC